MPFITKMRIIVDGKYRIYIIKLQTMWYIHIYIYIYKRAFGKRTKNLQLEKWWVMSTRSTWICLIKGTLIITSCKYNILGRIVLWTCWALKLTFSLCKWHNWYKGYEIIRDKNIHEDDTSDFFKKLASCICGNDLEMTLIFYLIK